MCSFHGSGMKDARLAMRGYVLGLDGWDSRRPRSASGTKSFVADLEVVTEVFQVPSSPAGEEIGKARSFSNAHMFTEPHFDFSP
jgi:hypothetical protein